MKAGRLRRAAWVTSVSVTSLACTSAVWAGRVARRRGDAGAVWPEWLPALLVRLGPSFVKFGQLLSTRRDLLPADWCRALSRLTWNVPAPPVADVAAVLGVDAASAPGGPPIPPPFARFTW